MATKTQIKPKLSALFGLHAFLPAADPRFRDCVKCGRPKDHPTHAKG